MTNQVVPNLASGDLRCGPNSNIELARQVLQELYRTGVRDVIFCAGARNAPLIMQLEKTQGFKIWSFFEERSAGFFALGRARATQRPVAVITTSGTAVAELLPATVEAFYSGVPLVLLTADRPKRLRGTGAPQSIVQPGIFSHYVAQAFDLENEPLNLSLADLESSRPVHVNICFDEPLLDGPIEPLDLVSLAEEFSVAVDFVKQKKIPAKTIVDSFQDFFNGSKSPVVIVGTLCSAVEQAACKQILLSLKLPVYLEGTSGLREDPDLNPFAIKSGDRLLSLGLHKRLYDGVLRLGGVPTVRVWRDLDNANCPVSVLSIHHLEFAGLGRGWFLQTPLSAISAMMLEGAIPLRMSLAEAPTDSSSSDLLALDSRIEKQVKDLLQRYSNSEASMVFHLSKLVGCDDIMYVGNSLSIRQWDNFGQRVKRIVVDANRGVNGIDGQISTFLGLARAKVHNWGLFGDLTTLYNLEAPWILPCLEADSGTIVVMNNAGGKIFEGIFRSELFQNNHQLDFRKWAEMWNLSYECWQSVENVCRQGEIEGRGHRGWRVVEIRPDAQQSKNFNSQFEALWKNVAL